MSSTEPVPDPLTAEGVNTESAQDPYEVPDDLMAVVEELCPVWPEGPTSAKPINSFSVDARGAPWRNAALEWRPVMSSVSRLGRQIEEIVGALKRINAPFALIGGLALPSHKVVRATQDVDLLIDADKADEIDAELAKLGYRCLHRSADAGNYVRDDERVDFLYASRPAARRLLATAREVRTSFGDLRVISTEGLIAFKLQALVNNPRRTQDLEDIRALLRTNRATLNMAEVEEYFRLFDRLPLLHELLNELH